jgi:hypothetical protein
MRIERRPPWQQVDLGWVTNANSTTEGEVLKLRTIRRQGTIAVLGRNLAVRVLIEKTARVESRDATVNDGDHEGSPRVAERVGGCSVVAAPAEADLP